MVKFIRSKALCLLTSIIIASNVFANNNLPTFYLKGNLGVNFFDPVNEYNKLKQKSFVSPIIGIGLGYYLNNRLRTDLTIDYTNVKFKKNLPTETNKILGNIKDLFITSIMVNCYIDLLKLEQLTVFFGGGIGIARIQKVDIWVLRTFFKTMGGIIARSPVDNISYNIVLGTALPITDSVYLELSYNRKSFGKTKKFQVPSAEAEISKYPLKDQHILLGLRINI